MALVLDLRRSHQEEIEIEHGGEVLHIVAEPMPSSDRVKLYITGPRSFDVRLMREGRPMRRPRK